MELADFLLARIAEDEAVAREVAAEYAGLRSLFTDPTDLDPTAELQHAEDGQTPFVGAHPARVLAECEAKREIVEEHRLYGEGEFWGDDKPLDDRSLACRRCGYPREFAAAWPCLTLRLLALPYAAHPDYDQAWRP